MKDDYYYKEISRRSKERTSELNKLLKEVGLHFNSCISSWHPTDQRQNKRTCIYFFGREDRDQFFKDFKAGKYNIPGLTEVEINRNLDFVINAKFE